MWVHKLTHLVHQPVMGWTVLQNLLLIIKWTGLGSLIFNPTRGEPTFVGSLRHV